MDRGGCTAQAVYDGDVWTVAACQFLMQAHEEVGQTLDIKKMRDEKFLNDKR